MRKWTAFFLGIVILFSVLPVFAEGGKTFRMAGFDDASSGHDWNNNAFFQQMEARTGLSFSYDQVTDRSAWTRYKAGLAAGENKPDVLFKADLSAMETLNLYESGVLIDLRPYLEEYAPHFWALMQENPEWLDALVLPDGAIAALPMIDPLLNNNAIWINKTWLAILQKAVPTTAEEFLEVLRAFKSQDPNRNGNQDEVPLTFTGMWDLRFLWSAFGIHANDYYLSMHEDGQVSSVVTSDENRAFLSWLHTMWDEKLVDRMGLVSGDTTRALTDSKANVIYGVVFGPSPMSMVPASQVGNYEVLMPFSYQGQKGTYRSFMGTEVRGTFAITSSCADPAALISWVDFLYTEEGCYLARSGREGVDYERTPDGSSWNWLKENTEEIQQESTIGNGGYIPGYVPIEYQLAFENTQSHMMIIQLAELAEVSALPYPQVYLTAEEQATVERIWPELGSYCETAMAHFVTGDVPLTDENWASFCQKAEELGLHEFVAVWQQAADR